MLVPRDVHQPARLVPGVLGSVLFRLPFAEYLVDHFSVKARRTGALGFQKVACMRDFLEWLKDSGFDHTNFSAV